jgi:Rap1a immunity proteins
MRALVSQRFRWARGAFAGYRRARTRRSARSTMTASTRSFASYKAAPGPPRARCRLQARHEPTYALQQTTRTNWMRYSITSSASASSLSGTARPSVCGLEVDSRPRKCRGAGGGGHALTGTRRDATAALILGLLAAALLAQNADAQTKPDRWSANYLMPACRNWIAFAGDRQGIDEALCAGIISGLAYTVKFLPPDSSSCSPQGVTTGEMVRVVVAYIERRPERMHEDFRRLVVEAWHEAWPCM